MGAWEEVGGELASSSDRDFERKVLPLLRLFWPQLQQVVPLKEMDRAGIDLFATDSDGKLLCVVQCKGFTKHQEFLMDQLPQAEKSVESFIKSKYRCEEYLFIHNRDGKNREVYKALESLCNRIVEEGSANSIEVIDRQSLIKKCKSKLLSNLNLILPTVSKKILNRHREYFLFGSVIVKKVPTKQYSWEFGYSQKPPALIFSGVKSIDSMNQLMPTRKWTMLLGSFGSGKTTVALSISSQERSKFLYVRCDEFINSTTGMGTNALLQNIIESIGLFNEYDPEHSKLMNRLSAVTLRKILCNPDQGYTLIIDALDESERYNSSRGLVQLTNELEELRCGIVLVTRQEHFDAIYGDFESVLDTVTRSELSVKGGKKRKSAIFSIESWQHEQQREFFKGCIKSPLGEKSKALRDLKKMADNNTLPSVLGELQYHPLFMHMLAEYVVEEERMPNEMSQLINTWLKFKIKRDFKSCRVLAWEEKSETIYVNDMIELTCIIAGRMVRTVDDTLILTDQISTEEVENIFGEFRATKKLDYASFASASYMVPIGGGRDSRNLRFFHRVIQEFCLAKYLVKERNTTVVLPECISMWLSELQRV